MVTHQKESQQKPDVLLVYMLNERLRKIIDYISPEDIMTLKEVWPEVHLIAIVSNGQQREIARKLGANTVLLEGITPTRLLTAIENAKPVIK